MEANPVCLDCNATTPVAPEVTDAIGPCLRKHFGNPSSIRIYGQRAEHAVEQAKAEMAELIGAKGKGGRFYRLRHRGQQSGHPARKRIPD